MCIAVFNRRNDEAFVSPHRSPRFDPGDRVLAPYFVMRTCFLILLAVVACSSTPATPSIPSPCGESCDDGDPCTVDQCQPARGVCLHQPSGYCTKACEKDTDCGFSSQAELPCVAMQCVAGQCRYQTLAEDDCVPCVTQADCAQTVCAPRQCQLGFCRRQVPDCDDNDSNTLDRCNELSDQCEHLLVDGKRLCEQTTDCVTDHPCEQFTCEPESLDNEDAVCRRTPDSQGCSLPLDAVWACTKNSDCIQEGGAVCVAGPCLNGFCRFQEYPYSDLCDSCHHGGPNDNDCDSSFCQSNVCTGTVCTQDPLSFCGDLDLNTVDSCSDSVRACLHEYVVTPEHCKAPMPSDGDASTLDACDPQTGTVHYLAKGDEPCTTTNRCYHAYPGENGVCLAEAIVCDDFDASTSESCDPAQGCVFEEPTSQCSVDSDCDDGNPCTIFVCLNRYGDNPLGGQTGVNPQGCWGSYMDGCVPCASDTDCLGDDWCLRGQCSPEGFCDYEVQKTCDDDNPCTADFCHGWVNETCTFHEISACSVP